MPLSPKPRLVVRDWVHKITSGDRVALGKAITLIESDHPKDFPLATAILKALPRRSELSYRIGVTGPPGVGKSTFINAWGNHLASSLAVLAVDPSSSRTQGSILGDKTRMESLSGRGNVFIRPSPSGKRGGSITHRTREVIRLCEAAGFQWILIETVGVGQSETDIRNVVDFVMLLVQPGAGDELQGIKKGIIELADGLVVTKADGESRKAADQSLADLRLALRLLGNSSAGAKVISCSALGGIGFHEVTEMVNQFFQRTLRDGSLHTARSEQNLLWMEEILRDRLERYMVARKGWWVDKARMTRKVASGRLSPLDAAEELWNKFKPFK